MWKTDWDIGDAGHRDFHNDLGTRLNAFRVANDPFYNNIQEAITAGGTIIVPAGTYYAGLITIDSDVRLIGMPGAVINCLGIVCEPSTDVYANVEIKGLDIRNSGAGSVGLYMNRCNAQVEDLIISGFSSVGLKVEYAITSHYSRVICSNNPIGLLITGDVSTTVTFSTCTFDQASTAAIKIEASANSILFDEWVVCQSSKRGMVIDSVSVISLINPYFENIEQDLITVGSTSEVQSLVISNPLCVGGASNNNTYDMFVFDRIRSLTWVGGDCRIPKASWIKTTANMLSAVISEPRHLGLLALFNDISKATVFYSSNNRFSTSVIQIGSQWLVASTFFLTPNDFLISGNGHAALYADPSGTIRIGASIVSGALVGGLEVDSSGAILRSANGSRFRLVVSNAGALSTTPA